MQAARLRGVKNIQLEDVPEPPAPKGGEVLIRIKSVGVCGSDLHQYKGETAGADTFARGLIMGHEFAAEIVAVGPDAWDGLHQPLKVGQRVAVDPETPCHHCRQCEEGHPNLCVNHTFCGLLPDHGALQELLVMQSRNCFPIPDSFTDTEGALLEPLGIGIHAVNLGRLKVADSVAVIGCGPIGLVTIKMAQLAGAYPIYAFDSLPWRAEKALRWGATESWSMDSREAEKIIEERTGGDGVDVAFEAAWADHSVDSAVEMVRYGGRVVIIGISADNKITFSHGASRRKGLTVKLVRRMKHTYPRAIKLVARGKDIIDLEDMVSHHFPLSQTQEAYQLVASYEPGVHKVMIDL